VTPVYDETRIRDFHNWNVIPCQCKRGKAFGIDEQLFDNYTKIRRNNRENRVFVIYEYSALGPETELTN